MRVGVIGTSRLVFVHFLGFFKLRGVLDFSRLLLGFGLGSLLRHGRLGSRSSLGEARCLLNGLRGRLRLGSLLHLRGRFNGLDSGSGDFLSDLDHGRNTALGSDDSHGRGLALLRVLNLDRDSLGPDGGSRLIDDLLEGLLGKANLLGLRPQLLLEGLAFLQLVVELLGGVEPDKGSGLSVDESLGQVDLLRSLLH